MSRRGRAVSADGTPKNPPAPARLVPLAEDNTPIKVTPGDSRGWQPHSGLTTEERRLAAADGVGKHRRRHCGICGRELVHAEDTTLGDPRIDCGGDCLACMWSAEFGAGETRAQRPTNFATGMPDGKIWYPSDGTAPIRSGEMPDEVIYLPMGTIFRVKRFETGRSYPEATVIMSSVHLGGETRISRSTFQKCCVAILKED